MKKFSIVLFFIVTLIITQAGCGVKTEPVSKDGYYLDTVCTITIYDMKGMSKDKAEASIDKVFKEAAKYEGILSRNIDTSEIGRLNREGHGKLDSKALTPIIAGVHYGDVSQGMFDISMGKVTELWDFHGENDKIPDDEDINAALDKVNYKDIDINRKTGEVKLLKQGMDIDLGGIAKGYICDRLSELLKKQGVTSAIVNLGGNITVIGAKPDGQPFKIGIEKPFSGRSEIVGAVKMKNQTIVTSGIYERFFEKDGVLYHHILNPETGYPVETDVVGVSILAKYGHSMDCDALSTTCLLLGSEKAKKLIEGTPGVEAYFLLKDGSKMKTKGFKLEDVE